MHPCNFVWFYHLLHSLKTLVWIWFWHHWSWTNNAYHKTANYYLAAKLLTYFHAQRFLLSSLRCLWYFLPILCIGSLKLELGSVTCLGAWLTCLDVVSWWGLSWQWELYIEAAWWEEQQPCAAFQGFYCNLAQKFNAFICFHGFFILLAFCT